MPEVLTQVDPEDSIEKLSGRELDAAVAERVMGFVRHRSGVLLPNDDRLHLWFDHAMQAEAERGELSLRVPRYSKSIEAAMEVVEAFIAKGGRVSLRGGISELMDEDVPPGYWQAHFFRYLKKCPPGTRFSFTVNAATLPEAICRAALKAIEAEQK